ncbi:MAG: hypothetical protein ACOC7W_04645 [Desulfosalsimonas sp.]
MNDHNHENDHGHHHHHHHGEEHDHAAKEMPVPEKLKKMVSHWIRHNDDHAATYRQWAQRAADEGMNDVAEILESVAEQNLAVNKDLEKAAGLLENKH